MVAPAPTIPRHKVDEEVQCLNSIAELRTLNDASFVTGYWVALTPATPVSIPFIWVLNRNSAVADDGVTVVAAWSGKGNWLRLDMTLPQIQTLVTQVGVLSAITTPTMVTWGVAGAQAVSYLIFPIPNTLDATLATVFTFVPPANMSFALSGSITARKSDGTTAHWEFQKAVFKTVAGVLSAVGTTPTFSYDPASSDAGSSTWGGWTVAISGPNVIVTVQGAAGSDIKYIVEIGVEQLS